MTGRNGLPDRPPIDPDSLALQYDIVEEDGVWLLERTHPEYPMRPEEAEAVEAVRQVLPTDEAGRIAVPDQTKAYLDAEPGDTISMSAVAAAQARVLIETLNEALEPVLEAVSEAFEAMATGLAEAVQSSSEPTDEVCDCPICEGTGKRSTGATCSVCGGVGAVIVDDSGDGQEEPDG